MSSLNPLDIITISGFAITLVGFIITIWQLLATKKLSKSAYMAAQEAQREIKNGLSLSNINTSIKLLQEIKGYIRDDKLESARLRLEDLISHLIQLKQLNNQQYTEQLDRISVGLRDICNTLEGQKPGAKVDSDKKVKINQTLSSYSDILSNISSKNIFSPTKTNGGKK